MNNSTNNIINRIILITDGGLDDAIALQFLFSNPKIKDFLRSDTNYIDIRCVSGCVSSSQSVVNTTLAIRSTKVNDLNNIFVTNTPAPYDNDITVWDGYGEDGVLNFFNTHAITYYPTINKNQSLSNENLLVLLLAPFTHANEILLNYAKNVAYITAMGGNDITPEEDEDIEFNCSMDIKSYNSFNSLCKINLIKYDQFTIEKCLKHPKLLIEIPDYLTSFYNQYKTICDLYTNRMIELNLSTACYDLIASIHFANNFLKYI